MKNVLVADVMTRDPVTINPDASLQDCCTLMVKKKIGSLILTEEGMLKGFISDQDILWAIVKKSKKDLKSIKAKDISPRKIITIKPTSTIQEAISKMNRTKFERLPVVKDNELLGIITAKDILNFHPEVYPEIEEFSRIKNESDKIKRIRRAQQGNPFPEEGICEECGNQDVLYRFNGMLVCDGCMGRK